MAPIEGSLAVGNPVLCEKKPINLDMYRVSACRDRVGDSADREAYERQIAAFARTIEGGGAFGPTFDGGCRALLVADAAQPALHAQRTMPIEH